MKIRADFVTNSSSSSFIAIFGEEKDRTMAEKSKELYQRHIYTGEYIKENWKNLKSYYTSEWFGVDPWYDYHNIENDKLYFLYWSSTDLTENENYNAANGYDIDEIKQHKNQVNDELNKLKGFKLEFAAWKGRNG